MFPLWEDVIAPVLQAGEVRTVVEIGALRGDNTRQVMATLGPKGVLHVIDPAPGFDPDEHQAEFPGRYVFHQDLSLNVLGDLYPMDAALIDGDHNWYTVVNELRLLSGQARHRQIALPILVLHDVGWPYGRRDLYYAPETIPAEFRQPHRRSGMRPGRAELTADGSGMSAGMWNAEVEGGPRNGVLTALEDWISSHDRPLRMVTVPVYFGLAIVVEQERLDRHPGLAAALDRIESAEGRAAQAALAEQIRVRAMANHHTVVGRLTAEAASAGRDVGNPGQN